MKIKKTTPDYIPTSEELPRRPGTYRVMTNRNAFTTSYFDGKVFEDESVIAWAERPRRK